MAQKSDIAMALDRLQVFADNLISMETNRRIQLGREKEDRMVDAYKYMLSEEEDQISELELALETIETNLFSKGVALESVNDEFRTIAGPELLLAANEGAMELVGAKLRDAKDYRERLEIKRREARKISRHIDLFDDAISLVDPAATGDPVIVEASDVAAATTKFWNEYEKYEPEILQRLEQFQTPEGLMGLQEGYFARLQKEIEQEALIAKADHTTDLGAIQSYEVPRQQIIETVKMRTQDPAMVLGRHFAPMGALKEEINAETVPNKKEKLETELAGLYAGLGSILYPQMMDAEGNWATPTTSLSAKMARDLAGSLALLNEGDPTEFVAYLDHVQSYYDEMKEDQTEQGRSISNRIRSEILALLGIDMEVPVKFGDRVLSQIEIIVEHYKELERIELEQSFHGMQISGRIQPNVSFDASYPSSDNQQLQKFMKSKLK